MNAQTPTLEWARQMDGGGTGRGYGRSITADATGNVYSVGYFSNTVDFDPGPGVLNLTAAGGGGFPDIFIIKVDPDGNLIWAKQMGGTLRDEGLSIDVDASGNVYTTGSFAGTADFDPGTGTFNLTASGGSAIFISKLDASSNFVWAFEMDSSSGEQGNSISVDQSGNILITGYFDNTVDFDPGAEEIC